MNIFLIGHNNARGAHLARLLQDLGHSVYGFSHSEYNINSRYQSVFKHTDCNSEYCIPDANPIYVAMDFDPEREPILLLANMLQGVISGMSEEHQPDMIVAVLECSTSKQANNMKAIVDARRNCKLSCNVVIFTRDFFGIRSNKAWFRVSDHHDDSLIKWARKALDLIIPDALPVDMPEDYQPKSIDAILKDYPITKEVKDATINDED